MENTSFLYRKLVAFGATFLILAQTTAFAEVLIFSNESAQENSNSIILDYDDTGGDVTLQFGNTLNEQLYWDSAGGQFVFTDDLYVAGNLVVDGSITSTGYIDFSGTSGVRLREDADPASNAVCINVGELIFDTTDDKVQYCTAAGAAGLATWQDIAGAATNTGSTENTFTLDSDDTGGNVDLVFGGTVGEYLRHDGNLFHFSDDVLMDDAGAVQFRDNALAINSSVDGQLDIDADVELEITAPTVDLNGDLDVSGAITGATIDGDLNTLQDIDFSSLSARIKKYFVTMSDLTVLTDGTNNSANLYSDSEAGTNPHQFYRVESGQSTLQDLDLKIKVKLPEDFVDFSSGTGDLSFFYKGTGANATESKLDILVEDNDGDAAFTPADGQGLFSTTWAEYTDEFDGASFDPAAGEYIYITIKGYASKTGGNRHKAFAGELVLTYTGR